MKSITPNIDWYVAKSSKLGLVSRCPFQNANACPRYYASLSLLGDHGCTKIDKAEDDRLEALWENHPLAPKTREQETQIDSLGYSHSADTKPCAYHNFCPEVAFDRFGIFATYFSPHIDEIDTGFAHERLGKENATADNPGWFWRGYTPQHYSECPLYSQLSHDWHKHLARPSASPPMAEVSPIVRFDVFVSHASEDKSFARPLAKKLEALGLRAWFDESAMKPGDSLRQEIDKGLAGSDFGIVILSKNFFKKQWTQAELNGLFTLKLEGKNRIIPIWHEITKTEIASHSPMVADLLAIQASDGADSVAVQILKVVRPAAVEVFLSSLPKQ